MKKLNNHARRWIGYAVIGAFIGLIFWLPPPGYGWSHPAPPTPFIKVGLPKLKTFSSNGRSMTLGERVAHQRAIEEVYWRHRTWPATNHPPKPRLDEVAPPEQIEMKVKDYLRRSEKLESNWHKPITEEMLRSEIARMASGTKNADMLKELWAALGNDPFVIAECLARPRLVNRASGWAAEPSVQSAGCGWETTSAVGAPGKRYGHTVVWTGSEMIVWGGCNTKDIN